MKRKKIFLLFLLFFLFTGLFVFTLSSPSVRAEDANGQIQKLQDQIDDYERQLEQLGKKKQSLANEIAKMNSQISLTTLKIQQTQTSIELLEEQIQELSGKIADLDLSLDNLSVIFLNRVVATYKSQGASPLSLLLSSESFTDFYRRWKYLKVLQLNDRKIMISLEEARSSYDRQRQEREEKQQQLENLKKTLNSQRLALEEQKKDRQYLLQATKSDEKKYQQLLAQVRAEYQAIQAVLAGAGDETEVGEIKKGEVIAAIISGSSCNSSGTHLHFTVTQDDKVINPFNFLKGGIDYENCSGRTCGSDDGDPFNPSGSWDWPVNPKITFTQGYGNTWAVNHTWVGNIYKSHNGIDFYGSSLEVKAVQDGTLYRGSYTGGGGCRLRYVRVDHKDSNIVNYYLHVNYEKI